MFSIKDCRDVAIAFKAECVPTLSIHIDTLAKETSRKNSTNPCVAIAIKATAKSKARVFKFPLGTTRSNTCIMKIGLISTAIFVTKLNAMRGKASDFNWLRGDPICTNRVLFV